MNQKLVLTLDQVVTETTTKTVTRTETTTTGLVLPSVGLAVDLPPVELTERIVRLVRCRNHHTPIHAGRCTKSGAICPIEVIDVKL